MRRKEFQMNEDEQKEIVMFLNEMTFGFLGTVSEDGYPHITPLNFVYYRDAIYFHGSKIGEKMSELKARKQVSFAVAKEFALIPSYFTEAKYACPATAFFKSVYIRGSAEIVDNLEEKADVFTAFMKKLQPEGGYAPFDLLDEGYVKQIKGTAIVKIHIEQMTAKFKFGQNWSENKLDIVTQQLAERDNDLDEETIRLMNKYCPHHR
jgi:nitroimidazol reductase NimA-like FMN-containing flavoprotein (pyridoxamine 5'-phosphate oxidase superfamily)